MRPILLALLAKEPAHGYELKQALEQLFGAGYPSPNIGQIYVTLGRLEKDGLVRGQDVSQVNRPNKKVYELTPAGRDELATWMDSPSDGPRLPSDFFVKVALAPMTGANDRMALVNKQRRHCLNVMRALQELAATTERDNPVSLLLIEGACLHLQADLEWLQRCQEELA